jgi:hypothetical protein
MDGADVFRHVLAGNAIATGSCLLQHPVAVQQADGESIKLGLGGVGNG